MSEYKYYIKRIYQPASDQVVLEVGNKNGRPVFSYYPGQYAMISYRNSRGNIEDKHAFSIASSPNEAGFISFGIKIQGSFTQGLLNLRAGDELRVFGPYGNFYYDENKYPDSVMIAGGIGITPFFSALKYAADLKLNNKLALIYSARTKNGATFYEEIRDLQRRNSNISTLFSFTEETDVPDESNVLHRRLDVKIIENFVGNISGKTFFICGPTLFMAAMTANLLSLGVARSQIKMEEFSMIPDQAFFPRLRNISYALAFSILIFIISISLIHKVTNASVKKNYIPVLINKVNQTITNESSDDSVILPTHSRSTIYTPAPVYVPAPVNTPSPTPVTGASPVR